MKYTYTYRTTALDLWQLSMYYTYGSMVGLCNVIFTIALWILTATQWTVVSNTIRMLMVFGCCLFTLIQPLAVYLKAKKQASGIQADTRVTFDNTGVHVTVGDQHSNLDWAQIKRVSQKPTMTVVFSDTTHGFILTNQVLGKEREAFNQYVIKNMKHK